MLKLGGFHVDMDAIDPGNEGIDRWNQPRLLVSSSVAVIDRPRKLGEQLWTNHWRPRCEQLADVLIRAAAVLE
jgi:hypothetical protein